MQLDKSHGGDIHGSDMISPSDRKMSQSTGHLAITSSLAEARETDSKWKVAGFVTRVTLRVTLTVHRSHFARLSHCCL